MELYQANQWTAQTQREKSWLCNELEMKKRSFQEDRSRCCQEIEALRRICFTEAERARQLRIDELSAQEKERKSTVHQLMVQIQELEDKVNSLSDAKEFYDPEIASSSGLSQGYHTFLVNL